MKNAMFTHWRCISLIFVTAICLSINSFAQPANDACGNAETLVSSTTCTPTPGALRTTQSATRTNGINTFCTSSANAVDVWYTFQAQHQYPTITLSNMGTSMDNAPRLQLFSTTSCTSANLNANSVDCVSGTNTTTLSLTPPTPLTVGNFYLIRVTTTSTSATGSAANWEFNICVTDPVPPANDLCANATPITSAYDCNPTSGSINMATGYTAITGACGTSRPDVWYRFTAQSTNPIITVGGLADRRFQVYTAASCGGTPSSVFCSTTTGATQVTGLTIGDEYLVRVFSNTGAIGNLTICVQDPPPPPSNDDCSGATTLGVNSSCDKVWGTVAGSTPSGVASTCGTPTFDVWYKFVAVAASQTVTINDLGAGFTNRRLQVFSGTCGALGTAIACVNAGSAALTGLTIGNTYYVRVFSTTATAPAFGGEFSICVTATSANIPPRYGNSYVNISKRTTGGVVEPGDTLEIRMAIYYSGGTDLYRPRYLDNVPTNTQMVTGAEGFMGLITNEGVPVQTFTLAGGDDAGTYVASPGVNEYNVRMNIGFGTTTKGGIPTANTTTDLGGTNTARMRRTDYPRGSGNLLFATAFRVVVTGAPGDVITLGTGSFIYRTGSTGGTEFTLNTTPYQILISTPQSLCTNATGVNNASEFGGTFGSGNNLNRPSDLQSPIDGYTLSPQSVNQEVNDGRYAIVKNTSAKNGTNPNAAMQPNCDPAPPDPNDACDMRMFGGYWDIIGDHTGTNDNIGNPPPAAGQPGGYMLVVNSDNVPSTVYRQSLNNLCPNTYYEFSAWFKNICQVCGADTTGAQNQTPGVNPNLTFVLDGVDRYSTGAIEYANGWVKKGFVFKTEIGQTSLNFAIRTNSQGGGGNDWAMDDISIVTCLPSMRYSPSLNPTVCLGNSITLNDTISSFFDNYVHYKWQRLPVGESIWQDIPGQSGQGTPTTVDGEYQYVTSYTVPIEDAGLANNGDRYRVIVATAAENLDNTDCNVTDGVSIIDVTVMDCTPTLKTDLLSFNGRLIGDKAQLNWTTTTEESAMNYEVERSFDGRSFVKVGSVTGYNNGASVNHYTFDDPVSLQDKVWYRISMVTPDGKKKQSSIIQLRVGNTAFDFGRVINPFSNQLEFDLTSTRNNMVHIELVDVHGKTVRTSKQIVYNGVNNIRITDTQSLAAGIYTLRVTNNDQVISKRVLKTN